MLVLYLLVANKNSKIYLFASRRLGEESSPIQCNKRELEDYERGVFLHCILSAKLPFILEIRIMNNY
jgi:hypothetical protein